ncbi:hypothetical protein L2D36_25405 [Vibrio harveyi]|uniref:hypothetical protein n=1 Tax=Vibrio TaxID=662 RepID=UPI0022CD2385|nr:hypothetical protein [Vibrio sp. NFR]MDA0135837.1 hypothetical protein [Vibrio sp. NFR]
MLDKYDSKLRSEFTYVDSPDHPNLISSPDALVAKKGEINAYYRVHSDEKVRLKNLLSRLAISRLALPVHTKHVLVLPEDNNERILFACISNFDRVIEDSDFTTSLNLLNDKTPDSIVERNLFLRDEHYVRFGIVYELSLSQESHTHDREINISFDDDILESVYYSDWLKNTRNRGVKKEFFKSHLFYKTERSVISIPNFNSSSKKMDLLRNICISSLQIESNFEDGVLESDLMLGKFIMSESVPSYKHDVLKGLRSASFCGLSLSGATNINSVNSYSEFLSNRIEGGIRELSKKKNRYIKRNRNW